MRGIKLGLGFMFNSMFYVETLHCFTCNSCTLMLFPLIKLLFAPNVLYIKS